MKSKSKKQFPTWSQSWLLLCNKTRRNGDQSSSLPRAEESRGQERHYRKGDPFQGPRLGSCLTLRNELSKETHVLTKQGNFLGWGAQAEGSMVKKPRELLCHMACRLSLWWSSLSFRLSLASHLAWNWAGPCGALGMETFLCPPLFVCRK